MTKVFSKILSANFCVCLNNSKFVLYNIRLSMIMQFDDKNSIVEKCVF